MAHMSHTPPSLETCCDGLWTLARPLRFMGVEVGTRMSVAQLDGGLWVSSPVSLDEPLREAIEDLGRPVRWVAAPNRYHHLYAGDFAEAFPEAELIGPPGLKAKRGDLDWNRIVDEEASIGDLELLRIHGMPMLDELVFFHRPSRTLIVADLLMNTEPTGKVFTDLVMKLDGVASGQPEVSRLFRAFAIRDRKALLASIDRLLAWDFDRLIVCHGRNLERGAKDVVAQALGRLRR